MPSLCCVCGVVVPESEANPSNQCVNCIRSSVDITVGLKTRLSIFQCRGCERYSSGGAGFVAVPDRESRELLALCLKQVHGLDKVRLVDAGFQWTEPH